MTKRIIGACLIIIITLAIYFPAIQGGFVWDDDSFLTNNPIIKAPNGLARFWFSTEPPDYFPLTSTTLWFEWRLWGMRASGYHVTNVFLHILSALLIWVILRRLNIPCSWLVGLLFAIHPVNVESVAWITQRKSTLPMFFYLLSIFYFLVYEQTQKRKEYLFSLGSFLLGLLSKTSIIMQPFVLLGCAWWQRGKVTRKDIMRVIPFLGLSVGLSLVTVWFQYNRSIGDDIVRTDSFLSRLAGAGWVVWFYIYKALVPLKLVFVYPRWNINAASILSYLPGVCVLGLLYIFWRFRKEWGRPFLFAFAYFAVTLFPVMGFFNIYYMRYSFVADHYQYVSIISIIALAVGIGYTGFKKTSPGVRLGAFFCLGLLIAALCTQTWVLCRSYKNAETLFRDTIAKEPNGWMANYNLGHLLQDEDRFVEAKVYYKEALRIQPNNPDPLNNMANIFLKEGKIDEAILMFQQAIAIKPDYAEGYYNLGCAYLELKRFAQAEVAFKNAIRYRPKLAKARNNLGNALVAQGKYAEALLEYKEAIRTAPKLVDAHINMGILLRKQGQYQAALERFMRVVQLAPDNKKARANIEILKKLISESGAGQGNVAQ